MSPYVHAGTWTGAASQRVSHSTWRFLETHTSLQSSRYIYPELTPIIAHSGGGCSGSGGGVKGPGPQEFSYTDKQKKQRGGGGLNPLTPLDPPLHIGLARLSIKMRFRKKT